MSRRTTPVRVSVLGPVEASVDDSSIPLRPTEKRIVAVLAASNRSVVPAERLLDEAWDHDPPKGGRKTLAFHVSRLRGAFRDVAGSAVDVIDTVNGGYRLASGVELTSEAFIRAVDDASAQLSAAPGTSRAIARRALDLWTGSQPFDGAYVGEAVTSEAHRLEELHATAFEVLAQAELGCQDFAAAIEAAGHLYERDPFRDTAISLPMRSLYLAGRQRDALVFYDAARKRLAEETGLEPGVSVQATLARIIRNDASLIEGAEADDDGPETVSRTTFTGRGDELARVASALEESDVVTIVGSGGVGKTRLALEFADGVDMPSTTAFLGPLRNREQVVTALSEALDAPLVEGRSLGIPRLDADGGRYLLVLDNCEHLLEVIRPLITEVIDSSPEMRVVATSREALGVTSESVVALTALRTSPAAGGGPSDAAQMFMDAARRVSGIGAADLDPAEVDELVEQLEGLPLALELAAARLRHTTTRSLLVSLQDSLAPLAALPGVRPARHSTLAAVYEWSYRLLQPDERETLEALTAFRGSFDLDAASAVSGATDRSEFDATVLSLVDKSLIEFAPVRSFPRYRLLETTRRFLRTQLSADDLFQQRTAHAEWVQDRVAQLAPTLRTADEGAARAALELDENNIRAAIGFLTEQDAAAAKRLIGDLKLYFIAKDHLISEVRALAEILDGGGADPDADTGYHSAIGALEYLTGDLQSSAEHYRHALEAASQTDDELQVFRVGNETALVMIDGRKTNDAGMIIGRNQQRAAELDDPNLLAQVQLLAAQTAPPSNQDAALLLARETSTGAGRKSSVAYVTEMRGWALIQYQQAGLALEEFRRSRNAWEELGNEGAVNSSMCGIGVSMLMLGLLDECETTLRKAVHGARSGGWSRGLARSLTRLTVWAIAAGDLGEAANLVEEATTIWSTHARQPGYGYAKSLQGAISLNRGDVSSASHSGRLAIEVWEDLDRADGIAATSIMSGTMDDVDIHCTIARHMTQPFVLNGSLFPEVLPVAYAMDPNRLTSVADLAPLTDAMRSSSPESWAPVEDVAREILESCP